MSDDKRPSKGRGAFRGNQRALGRLDQEINDNYTMMQGFEWYEEGGGKFWNEFAAKSKELGDMGITAAWLPPPTKGSGPDDVGYGVYDIWDLGEYDQKGGKGTKYGTKEEYIQCIKTCKENGIVIYLDAVLNHRLGADGKEVFRATQVDENDRTKDVSDLHEIEGWTRFDFAGRTDSCPSKLKQLHHYHFTGVDFDNKTGTKGIFRIQGDGKDFSHDVDSEKGGYDYLMGADVDYAHPEIRADVFHWGDWIIKETGIAGIRFDAVKHIDKHFMAEFVKHLRTTHENEDLFTVGEFWKDSIGDLQNYIDTFSEQFSVFDTPLHYNFKEAGDRAENYDLRAIWDGTLVKSNPLDAVTLVDNHDSQPTQSLESWISPQFKPLAYALILFRNDGYPCVFAGDLYGCKSDPKVEPMSQLADFIRIRKLFTYGLTRDYWDHPNTVGWVREGDKIHDGCAVVICNGNDEGRKRMQVPDGHAGEKWVDALGWSQGEIEIGDDGWAEFKCPAHSVSVWVNKEAKGLAEFKK